MPNKRALAVILIFLAAGCSKLELPPITTLSAAEKRFNHICQEEYNFTPVTFRLRNTVWIYIPLEKDIFAFKASDQGPSNSTEASKSFAINYLDGSFTDATFRVQYDIGPVKKYAKDPGYTTVYSDQFQERQRAILTAIFRAYGELPTDKRSPDRAPDFFVLVIADIKTGLETKTIFYFPDFKRAMTDQFFYEEFTRRTVSDDPVGDTAIIGDTAGKHLRPKDIVMGEFLAKQIIFRIRYKFQRSDFPPEGNVNDELLGIIRETAKSYGFTDYRGSVLTNLLTGESQEHNP